MRRIYADGWKEIAALVGKSDRWCRYAARRPVRPLPVGYVGGMARMVVAEFEAWQASELALPKVEDTGWLAAWGADGPPAKR